MSRILIKDKNGLILADQVILARSTMERMRGLLGRKALADNTAMLIEPCRSIHMWFMQFPIDAVFLDQSMQVLKIVQNLKPWQLAFAPRATYAVLETAARRTTELHVGDRLIIESLSQ